MKGDLCSLVDLNKPLLFFPSIMRPPYLLLEKVTEGLQRRVLIEAGVKVWEIPDTIQ